ncbi:MULTISPECIES: OsmC family protein [unclassified Leifsonia]|uniref:OsmC family protein n=1 Tax=unclassified Leifsonia TaxID=2663824 RepID=UPI0006F9C40C|nr:MULTISPECIES: OsmC family protein [unclassified Leifsonia]KQX06533.1 peroxiredoxin [Leifsonia sp. Root1293]KRA10816.1 peroxiredoxin [Leifsonia sp. Root60]
MDFDHHYAVTVDWQGDRGTGTSGYREYGREHLVAASGKPPIDGSADPAFRGDPARWNPEEMLLAALAQCHMLSYLHVAVAHGVVVTGYSDAAVGSMRQTHDGGGHFTSVTLRPRVEVADPAMIELAASLHREASEKCFIAASVNFPVGHEPETRGRS